MPLITLTTDFGTKDYFVSAVKGAIYSELSEAIIVDITHRVSPFNIAEAAYIVKNSYKNFPNGTIHIIGVEAELSLKNKHIALALNNHFFICSDNGFISMITSEIKPSKIVEINIQNHIKSSFPVLDIFVQTACFIARGGDLTSIGHEIKSYKKMIEIQPKINDTQIVGGVVYIDNYGNVISNISRKIFNQVGKGRNFKVLAGGYSFSKIVNRYNEIINGDAEDIGKYDGNKLALFNTTGYLEIAIYKSNTKSVGGASTLLGLKYRDTIIVEFF